MQRQRRSSLSQKPLALGVLFVACLRTPEKSRDVGPTPAQSATLAGVPSQGTTTTTRTTTSAQPSLVTSSARPAERVLPRFEGGKNSVSSSAGLVVAVEERAARIGAEVLKAGGNAADAAIATALALAVTHPSAGSLGGGGFALVRPPGGPTSAIDFRETAPAALTRGKFDRMIAAHAVGKSAVGVPGVVAGMALIHARFGTRPFGDLARPALGLARDGYPLGAFQAKLLRGSFGALGQDRAARAVFAEQGKSRPNGSRLMQADLAWTLGRLASDSPQDFYTGQIADRLARALAPDGPSLADLKAYKAIVREPLRIRYRDTEIETMPPPSAGGVALVGALLVLGSLPPLDSNSVEGVHVLLEAQRRAQAERRLRVLDPDALAPEELQRRLADWVDPKFWLKVPLDPTRPTASEALTPLFKQALTESQHTTHISVVDKDGMAVSWTTTLSASFGAKVMAAGTGVLLNNSVASFSRVGDNLPVPGRRTTSSMAPTLLLNEGRVSFVLGTPGGDTIPSTLTQIVRRLVDDRAPLADAIEAPRFHHGFVPDIARYEPRLRSSLALLRGLEARGHRLRPLGRPMGDANCILIDGTRAVGYADSREPGVAVAADAN